MISSVLIKNRYNIQLIVRIIGLVVFLISTHEILYDLGYQGIYELQFSPHRPKWAFPQPQPQPQPQPERQPLPVVVRN